MPLYRARRPSDGPKPTGRRAERRAPFYAASKRSLLVRLRLGGYACEACGASGVDLDPDHVYGRAGTGARLGWPWCDLPELLAGICRQCHERKTNPRDDADLTIVDALQRTALARFCIRGVREGWLSHNAAFYIILAGGDLVGAIRRAQADAEKSDDWRAAILGDDSEAA